MVDQKCFGTVIDAWSKADDKYQTAENAESVLMQMEDLFLHSESNNPKEMLSNIAYNSGEPSLPPSPHLPRQPMDEWVTFSCPLFFFF
jgi:hypothetical protein